MRQDWTSPGTGHSALLRAGSPPHPRSRWRPSAGPVRRILGASWALRGQHWCLAQGTPGMAPGQPSHSRPPARWAPAGAFWDDGQSLRPRSGPSRWSSCPPPPPPCSGTWQSRGSVLRKEAKSIHGGPLGPGAQEDGRGLEVEPEGAERLGRVLGGAGAPRVGASAPLCPLRQLRSGDVPSTNATLLSVKCATGWALQGLLGRLRH